MPEYLPYSFRASSLPFQPSEFFVVQVFARGCMNDEYEYGSEAESEAFAKRDALRALGHDARVVRRWR